MMYRVIGGFYGFAFYGSLFLLGEGFFQEGTVQPAPDAAVCPGAFRTFFVIKDTAVYILIGKKKGFAAVHTEDTPFDGFFAVR